MLLSALQVKVTADPGSTLPGVGLMSVATVALVAARLTVEEAPAEELLFRVSVPVVVPVLCGAN